MSITVKFNIPSAAELVKKKGLDKDGDVQKQWTSIVNKRITRYMPYRTGVLSGKKKIMTSNSQILIEGPYAQYQYYGKVMVGPPPKVATDRPLDQKPRYPGNDRAGPFWDKALKAAEMQAMVDDLQRYIDRRD